MEHLGSRHRLCLPQFPPLLRYRALWEGIRLSPVVRAAGLARRGELHHAQQQTTEPGLEPGCRVCIPGHDLGQLLPPSASASLSV